MKAYKLEGIVIRRRNVGEADRIITLFSKTKGKVQIRAKGVRRIASRRSGHIELLNYGIFNLHQGKNLPILTEVQSLEDFDKIKKDLKKIGFAYHLCELIDGLCAENQENFEIFMLLGKTLRKISLAEDPKGVIKEFEYRLLNLLGFHSLGLEAELDSQTFIENLLERKLKTKQIIPLLS